MKLNEMTGISKGLVYGNSSSSGIFPKGKYGNQDKSSNEIYRLDDDWLTSRFIVPSDRLPSETVRKNRFMSSTYWKYTNSSLGGNYGINPKPQFTSYADIRYKTFNNVNCSRTTKYPTKQKSAMGRYYSEVIDDNEQIIHMEFGLPKFNSLLNFFTAAIDYRESIIAAEGRNPRWYDLGKKVGGVGVFIAFPYTTILIFAIKTVSKFLSTLGGTIFKYYYLEPAMHLYWGSVSNLVTNFAIELGILPPTTEIDEFESSENDNMATSLTKTASNAIISGVNKINKSLSKIDRLGFNKDGYQHIGTLMRLRKEDIKHMNELFNGMINERGYFDVLAIASKQNRVYYKIQENFQKLDANQNYINSDPIGAYKNYVESAFNIKKDSANVDNISSSLNSLPNACNVNPGILDGYENYVDSSSLDPDGAITTLQDYIDVVCKGNGLFATKAKTDNSKKTEDNKTKIGNDKDTAKSLSRSSEDGYKVKRVVSEEDAQKDENWFQKYINYIKTSSKGGIRFANFYVDYTGTVSDSFSNSVGPISTETGAKSIAQAARNFKFMVGGDNFLGGDVGSALGSIKDFAAGALDSITFGLSNVLTTLLGGAYIDMPQKWEDSDTSLGSVTYNMHLVSPYGNPISQMINIYIPLAMILAGALPQSTGKSSYTSPFLCSVFDRGIQYIRLGMITSVSINRGVTNLPYTRTKKPLGIDVSFTVTNLSQRLAAPITSSVLDEFNISIDDDRPIMDYIATLCGRDHKTSKYNLPKIRLKLAKARYALDRFTSPSYWGTRSASWFPSTVNNPT